MTETFDPASNGWKVQRDYTISPIYQTAHDERENGASKSTRLNGRKPRRVIAPYTLKAITPEAGWYLESFRDRHQDNRRFYMTWPEYLAPSDIGPTLEAVTSGAQGARTVTVCFTWTNAAGETIESATTSISLGAGELVKVTLPQFPAGATGAVIYAAEDDAGNEVAQTTRTLEERTWTQPDAALLTGTSSPPSSNTALETVLCRFRSGPQIIRGLGQSRVATMEIEEVFV